MAVEGFPYPHPRPVGAAPERPDGAPPGGARPGWRPWTGILALVSGLAGALMGALVLGVVAAAGGASLSDLPGWVNVASTIVQDVAFIAAALLFARAWATPTPAQFGLRPAPVRRSLGLAVLAWVAFYAFTAIFVAALGLHPSEEDLQDQLGVHGTAGLAAIAVLVTVVAPVAEEFLFRGYVFTALRNWRGIWPAAVITGLLFGGVHAGGSDPSYLVPLAFFGFVLCLLYVRTGSLWPCIALHCANNSVAFGVSQGWSWQVPLLFAGALALIAVLARAAVRALANRTTRPAAATAA
jgi:uncharacterized protein